MKKMSMEKMERIYPCLVQFQSNTQESFAGTAMAFLFISPFGGMVVDKVDRKKRLIGCGFGAIFRGFFDSFLALLGLRFWSNVTELQKQCALVYP